jgi:hypothetical protein
MHVRDAGVAFPFPWGTLRTPEGRRVSWGESVHLEQILGWCCGTRGPAIEQAMYMPFKEPKHTAVWGPKGGSC